MNLSDISKRLLRAESDLNGRHETVMAEISICIESALKGIITLCYKKLSFPPDIKKLKTIENQIGGNDQSYLNFGLGKLIKLWKDANIPLLWGKFNSHIPAIFKTIPFQEIKKARNLQIHQNISPPPIVVKRLYYTVIEFFEEAFPNDLDSNVESKVKYPLSNLPRVDCEFIGRITEKNKILDLLSTNSRHFLISITGVGGVGKSALALEVACRCFKESQKDEQTRHDLIFDIFIWTSAKRKSLIGNKVQNVLSIQSNLDDIIAEIIKIASPDQYKNLPDPQRQYEIAKKILTDYRTLLIVDNMETIEDEKVISFLNELPHLSKAIITDRRCVQPSVPIHLRELSKEDSYKLISDLCKQHSMNLNEEQINDLAMKTGGIPLAILWSISQMSVKNCGSEPVLRSLANTGSSPVLEYLFSESFKQISSNSKKILAAISITETSVIGRMLSDWGQLGEHDAQDSLTELMQYALISEDIGTSFDMQKNMSIPILERRYKVLPLTRNFVKLHEPELDLSLRIHISNELFKMLSENEKNPEWPSMATIDLVDNYHDIFTKAIEDAFERNDDELVIKFMRYIGYSLSIRGHHNTRLKLAKITYEAAKRIGKTFEAAKVLIKDIGWVYFCWYKFDECIQNTIEGKSLVENNKELQAIAIRNLGLVEKERGNLSEAESMLFDAKEIFKGLKNHHFLSVCYGSIGSLKRDQKQYDEAENYFIKAINIAENLENSEEIVSIFYQKMSRLLVTMNRIDEAEIFTRKALNIHRHLKRQVGLAHCKLFLARIAEKRGEIENARLYAKESAELFTIYGAKEDITEDLNRLQQ